MDGGVASMSERQYELKFTTVGPVHIGNGNKYGKKDYFYTGKEIAVLDIKRFVASLNKEQIESYCNFLENEQDKKADLHNYLKNDSNLMNSAKKAIAYKIDSPLAIGKNGSVLRRDVFEFVKDAYGNPYIPGSSVKGMIRTVLWNALSFSHSEEYRPHIISKNPWKIEDRDVDKIDDIMRYISVSDSEPLSTKDLVFVEKYDLFSIRDDVSHKPDTNRTDYRGNELNIYRECLRSNTSFSVTLSIDTCIDNHCNSLSFDINGLQEMFKVFYYLYSEVFLSHFDVEEPSEKETSQEETCCYVTTTGSLAGKRCMNRAVDGTGYCNIHKDKAVFRKATEPLVCYLGGGIDFISKTIVSALFDDQIDRVSEISQILYGQFPTRIDESINKNLYKAVQLKGFEPKYMKAQRKRNGRLKAAKIDHRHWLDQELGVSPHTLKLGLIGNKKYPMGKCTLEIQEK